MMKLPFEVHNSAAKQGTTSKGTNKGMQLTHQVMYNGKISIQLLDIS